MAAFWLSFGACWALLKRELLLGFRRKTEILIPVTFCFVVSSLFPLGVGPETAVLRQIAPGVLWVVALLAIMLSLPRLLEASLVDGSLEQLQFSPAPMPLLLGTLAFTHWLLTCIPLILFSPLLGLLFDLPAAALGILLLSLLLGTPVLVLIGSIGAALTLGLRGGGVLLALVALPLFVPVLIFGAGAVESFNSGLGAGAHLSLLAALLLLSALFCPLISAYAVKIATE